MLRPAIKVILKGVRLQELIHHAAFRYIQGKKTIFIQALSLNQLIIFKTEAMDRIILAERALINPAVGKNEVILCHPTGTGKGFLRPEKDLGIGDMDTGTGRLSGHLGHDLQPMAWINLPLLPFL